MTNFAILFQDNEEYAEQRARNMAAHCNFLSVNASTIKAAGPLKKVEEGGPAGGLWLVEADTIEEVQQLVKRDPLWTTGLRKSVEILEWNQVFAEGRKLP